jgi:hypothetical protein
MVRAVEAWANLSDQRLRPADARVAGHHRIAVC